MDWNAIGAIGEVLGALGVIVTLGYLAMQIRQNTRSMRSQTYGQALDRVTTLQGRLSESGELADILLRGVARSESLTPEERVRFSWVFYEMFSSFEYIFHQARDGALPDGVWDRWSETLRWWVSFRGVRDWWHGRPAPFTPEFSRFVDECVAQPEFDPEASARFQQYLTHGRPAG
jgi:hypothetical protein